MKILFGVKYYGKDVNEVPSGFLIWIIEEYADADWSLIQACKKELATRLKLEWTSPPGPLSKDETMHAFRWYCLDKHYDMGWTEEAIMNAGGKEIQWTPKKPSINAGVGVAIIKFLEEITRLREGKIMFEKIAWIHGVEPIDYEKYFRNPDLLEDDIQTFNSEGMRKLPDIWSRQPLYQKHLEEERAKDAHCLQRLIECKTIEDLNNLKREVA